MAKKVDPIEVVISFDTTGSMYPCLTQVRREVKTLVSKLFRDIPGIRMGVIAHGDYCDEGHPYVTKLFELSNNADALCKFVTNVEPTGGGDSPECYELVLHQARSFNWSTSKKKVLVLIGDDVPHGKNEAQNRKKLDWRQELKALSESGINVYGVQALNRSHATKFYETIAEDTGGFHLELDQFADVTNLIMAVAYKQQGDVDLQEFEQEVIKQGRMNRATRSTFNRLLNRKETDERFKKRDLDAVPPGRFQVMRVEDDTPISDFVRDQGIEFKIGRGFYEFTRPVDVQKYKEVIVEDKVTGDLYTGDKAREMAGIPIGKDARVTPSKMPGSLRYYIQSTSNNRKLLAGTRFLYEVS